MVRVYRPARHGRLFGAVVGGAIGVAAGGIMDGTLGQRFRNEGDSPAKGVLTAAGAGVGVGIGAAVTGGYRTVYRARNSFSATSSRMVSSRVGVITGLSRMRETMRSSGWP